MMRRLLFLCLCVAMTAATTRAATPALDSIYNAVDQAVAQRADYLAQRQQRIQVLNDQLAAEHDSARCLPLLYKLFDQYRPYINDSAIHYLSRYIRLADRLGDHVAAEDARTLLAYQCSNAGFYVEALTLLQGIDTTRLSPSSKTSYLHSLAHLYGELGYYCEVPSLRDSYYAQRARYRNQLLATADTTTALWMQHQLQRRYDSGDLRGAERYSRRWLASTPEGSHERAIAAYYTYLVYSAMGDSVRSRYYVAQSALCDVKNAVTDQGSVWELANLLNHDGDMRRSRAYIQFAWDAAQIFNTRVRNNQISPVLTMIDENYQTSLAATNRKLSIMIVVVSLLSAILLASLLYTRRQRQRIAAARQLLSDKNDELANLNNQLVALNDELHNANSRLSDSNRVKDEYVGQFLQLCSIYIDRMDDLRSRVGKLVKKKDFAELSKLTHSQEFKEKNLAELHESFDTAFLQIFPNFVDDFNALLKPECRIRLADPGKLNTDIRIFALIRLGINDSARIADFLHYSVNTIYNYRARVKNGAIGNRDSFEDAVKSIALR